MVPSLKSSQILPSSHSHTSIPFLSLSHYKIGNNTKK